VHALFFVHLTSLRRWWTSQVGKTIAVHVEAAAAEQSGSRSLPLLCLWRQQLQNSQTLGAGHWASGASNKTEPRALSWFAPCYILGGQLPGCVRWVNFWKLPMSWWILVGNCQDQGVYMTESLGGQLLSEWRDSPCTPILCDNGVKSWKPSMARWRGGPLPESMCLYNRASWWATPGCRVSPLTLMLCVNEVKIAFMIAQKEIM
jgi:hypothetical protein